MRRVEFWPDYGGALLHEAGGPLAIETLALPDDLATAVGHWLARYDDAKLDPSTRDESWIAEGQQLFDILRRVLLPSQIELTDWEGYWDRSGHHAANRDTPQQRARDPRRRIL